VTYGRIGPIVGRIAGVAQACGVGRNRVQRPVTNVRAFLFDDHEVVRRGIRDLLEDSDIDVVREAGSVGEGRRRILELKPDVAVLDARLPDGSGIDVCRDIRSADPSIRGLLILTSHEDDEALFCAIWRAPRATSSRAYAEPI
jgi:DNA-binding NarL/FixJ family response regulator